MFEKSVPRQSTGSDLDIPASSYVSAYLPIIPAKLFLSLKRIREYVSRSLLHQAASSEREDNGVWVEAMCRGVAGYVGSLRVVVTSDGHTMLVSSRFSIKSILFSSRYSRRWSHATFRQRSNRFFQEFIRICQLMGTFETIEITDLLYFSFY